MFGPDFQRAKTEWLYPVETLQWFWRALLFFIILVLLDGIFQTLSGAGTYILIYSHSISGFFEGVRSASPDILKASIIGMLPSAIVLIACALILARLGLPQRQGRLPLTLPRLGALGWIVVVLGFVILMFVIFNGLFAVLGIDPETYSPSGGLRDSTSASGLVEKTMADLSHNPVLFAFALPGIVLAAPITEELIFRGAFFSALVNSPVGRVGAVVITSALWALAHALAAPWLFVGVIFCMGLVLGTLLLRFGSLWVTIACHTVWNLLSSLAIFGVGSHS